ncbi:MAG: VWA domain-containing protein [Gammaproteobacteria bacterium]|nr:VWA domain-containing protein [Gammaproteobacteria bacterium]MCW8983225.1 VWA domain-containing protein [Gammaproteobacteria bacterium]
MKQLITIVTLMGALLISGCGETTAHNRGVYMLLDTSGTYTRELQKAQQIINFVLAKMEPTDSFAVARIDTGSFSEKDIVSKITFDDRPSQANREKLKFRDDIDQFVKTVKGSSYTDITGGILQSTEYLDERKPGIKTILIFSDMKEEIKKGFMRDIPLQLDGYEVVALNVTKLRSDNIDPREYMQRLEQWQQKVEQGGGRWRVINDLEQLEGIFEG